MAAPIEFNVWQNGVPVITVGGDGNFNNWLNNVPLVDQDEGTPNVNTDRRKPQIICFYDSVQSGPVLPVGLLQWFKADAITGASDTDPLAAWTDQSGNGFDATQVTPAQQPVYRTGQINSLPAVQFVSPSHFFNLTNPFTSQTEAELFVVVKLNNDPPTTNKWGQWRFAGTGDNNAFPFTDGVIYDGFCSTLRKTVGNPTPSLAAWRLYNTSSAASSWIARLDGTQIFSTTSNVFSSAATGTMGTFRLLGATASVNMDGFIAEVILFDHVLSAEDRTTVESYIADKYALTIA